MASKRSRENALFGGASRRQERDVIDALAEEIATLREENQRLAREHYRPASAGRTASEIRNLAASLDEHLSHSDDAQSEESADAAVAIALETEMIRRGLVEVCELLQTMGAQLSASLTNSVPLHEIDRRLRSRGVEAERRDHSEDGAQLVPTNGKSSSSNGNGNGHYDAIDLDLRNDTAVASAQRHLQMIGDDGEANVAVANGTTGTTEWWAARAAVWERAPLKDVRSEAMASMEGPTQTEAPSTLGRSGYYDRVPRSDGNAQ